MSAVGHTPRTVDVLDEWPIVGFVDPRLIIINSSYSDPPKMENLTGAASHGRKVRIGSV